MKPAINRMNPDRNRYPAKRLTSMPRSGRTGSIFLIGILAFFFLLMPQNVRAAAPYLERNSFPESKTVYINTTTKFSVKELNGTRPGRIRWKSDNPAIARVSGAKGRQCKVTWLKTGKTTISCYVKGKKKRSLLFCTVSVKKCTRKISSIKFPVKRITLYVGDTYTNQIKIKPSNTRRNQLEYSVSKKAVASVSSRGKVTAKKTGKSIVTAAAVDGSGKSGSYELIVTNIAAETNQVTIKPGETYALPLNGTTTCSAASKIIWKSSDPTAVSVDQQGVITGTGIGRATITAAVANKIGQSVSFHVTVSFPISRDSTHFIAHRGLSSKAPENTLLAFELAGKAGFWGTECDIHRTADGHFIILHNDTFQYMCGVNRKPEEMTLDEIRELHIIRGNQYEQYKTDPKATTVPTLEEYLSVCLYYHMTPVIEIKTQYEHLSENDSQSSQEAITDDTDPETPLSYTAEEDMKSLYELIRSVIGDQPFYVIAFDYQTLIAFKDAISSDKRQQVTFQYLSGKCSQNVIDICKENQFDISLNHSDISAETLTSLKKQGINVGLWTVDKTLRIEQYLAAGIDYITTNILPW